ncbi:MAG: hypothetical protein H6510_11235 [Acidobacteria bacterium]|nr:hypothetical protein [Acidobacteriota bacterium]MCB9398378.1 hypothetical protein [Acidobacteriota bacterium]
MNEVFWSSDRTSDELFEDLGNLVDGLGKQIEEAPGKFRKKIEEKLWSPPDRIWNE